MVSKLRIAELQYAVEFALEDAEYQGQSSARVQSVPDTRAIRYYTTLGILDRAAEMKGRTAFYDERHVLQLVAIKRLQAKGMTLGEIQQKITGLSNRKLTGIAGLSKGFWDSLEKELSKRADQTKKFTTKSKPVKRTKDAEGESEPQAQMMILNQAAITSALASDTLVRSGVKKSKIKPDTSVKSKKRSATAFWAAPVEETSETLARPTAAQITVRNETRIEFPNGIAISIPISNQEVTPETIQQLLPSVNELASRIESIRRK